MRTPLKTCLPGVLWGGFFVHAQWASLGLGAAASGFDDGTGTEPSVETEVRGAVLRAPPTLRRRETFLRA